MFEESGPPRGMSERLVALGSLAWLAPVPAFDLARLARLARERDFAAGELLARAGEPVEAVQLLLSGKVSLSSTGKHDELLGESRTIGLLALAAGARHPSDARVLEPVHALELQADPLLDALEDSFDLFARVLSLAARTAWRRGQPRIARGGAVMPLLGAALGPAERLLVLRGTDLFGRAPVDGLATFAKHLREVTLVPGETLAHESGTLTIIAAGESSVADSRPAPAGTVVGALEALADEPSAPAIEALTTVRALRGTAADLLDTLEDHREMGRRLLAEILEEQSWT